MDKEKVITLAVIGIGTLTGVCIIPFSPGIGWAITIFGGFGIVVTGIALLCVAISAPLGKLTDAISDRCGKLISGFVRVLVKVLGNTVNAVFCALGKLISAFFRACRTIWKAVLKKLLGFTFFSAILYIFSVGICISGFAFIEPFKNNINLILLFAAIYPLLFAFLLIFGDRHGIRAACFLTIIITNAIFILGVSWMQDGFIAIAELKKVQFIHNEEILRSIIAAVDVLSGSLLIIISLLAFKFFCIPKKPKAK